MAFGLRDEFVCLCGGVSFMKDMIVHIFIESFVN